MTDQDELLLVPSVGSDEFTAAQLDELDAWDDVQLVDETTGALAERIYYSVRRETDPDWSMVVFTLPAGWEVGDAPPLPGLAPIYASRFDPRAMIVLGFVLQAYAGWQLAQLDVNPSTADVFWPMALQGFGVGVLWVPITMVTFATLEPSRVPGGSAVFHMIRNFGSAVHISLSITLAGKISAKREYTLRLHFLEPDDLQPGERVFSVRVQGQPAIAAIDVAQEAGGQNVALVKELRGVEVSDKLVIELLPHAGTKMPASVLSGVEIQAEGW